MLRKVEAIDRRGHHARHRSGAAPEPRALADRQRLMAGLALALIRQQDLQGLLAETCRLCLEALPVSSIAVLEHQPAGAADVVRASAERLRPDGAAPVQHHVAPCASLCVPGDGRPYGVLRAGRPEARPLDPAELASLATVAELLGAAITRLDQDDALRRAHVREAALAEERREMIGELQHRIRNDLQVLHGFAHLRARQTGDAGSAADFDAISRRLVSLAALYDHLLGAGLERQVEFGDYLRNLCARIEAAEDLAGRGITLEAELCQVALGFEAAVGLGVAVNELVANAAEHAFGGRGGRIVVRLMPGTDPGGPATLLVADDGCGFEHAPEGGTGLSYVRRMVARAGARIEREDGGGTTWRILLR